MIIPTKRKILSKEACVRLENRSSVETLFELAQHLEPRDQQLLSSYFESQFSLHELSRIHRMNRPVVRRRIATLVSRLADPMFRAVIKYHSLLPEDVSGVLFDRYILGHTWRRIADDHHLKQFELRQHLTRGRYMVVALTMHDTGRDDTGSLSA